MWGVYFCMGAYKHEVVVSGALKWLLNKGLGVFSSVMIYFSVANFASVFLLL